MTPSAIARDVLTAQVVIAGDDVYEDLFTASVELQDLLASAGFVTRVRMGTALFAQPLVDNLIVLYRAAGAFTAEEQRGLAAAVAGEPDCSPSTRRRSSPPKTGRIRKTPATAATTHSPVPTCSPSSAHGSSTTVRSRTRAALGWTSRGIL
ncbi:hypothetical protein [Leifsonia poae]|uniref:hypothetical protein n=1 Tax=Leifsonia poae TaxID=110933 RepID=UPI003D66A397